MRVVVAKDISPKNVNLALVDGTKIKSDDVIQIKDLSLAYTYNQLPIFTEARQCTVLSTGALDITNDTLTPHITSEYNYSSDTSTVTPLWLKYKLMLYYYNETIQNSVYTISSTQINTQYQFMSLKSQAIPIINTFKVEWYTVTGWYPIPSTYYTLDLGRRNISINNELYSGQRVRVTYNTLNMNISIYDENKKPMPLKYVRVEPSKYRTTPGETDEFQEISNTPLNNIYDTTILFANVLEDNVTYFVEYSTYSFTTNTQETRLEVINPDSLYTKVVEFLSHHSKSAYVYTVDPDTFSITTKLNQYWPVVFVKYPTDRNSNIALLEPQHRTHDVPWFIELSNDKIINETDDGTFTYQILEAGSNPTGYSITNVTEDISKIDQYLIKTNYNDLHLRYNNVGTITNITLRNNDIDISNMIEWVDARRGIIKLTKDINISQRNNYISYQYRIYNVSYRNINVNPFMMYNQTNSNIVDKFVMFYMLPIEELRQELGRSVFHTIVYKTPEIYEGLEDHVKSIIAMRNFLLGTSNGVSNLYTIIPEYLSPDIVDTSNLHPIILGYVNSTNITTANNIAFTDIRRRGGGLRVEENVDTLLDNQIRHYLDIAPIDGYEYNLSNVAIVHIRNAVKTALMSRFGTYDVYAQRQIRSNPNFILEAYVESYIRHVVQKYLCASTHAIINYKE